MAVWFIKSAATALHVSGMDRVLDRMSGRFGSILMLHQVRAARNAACDVNAALAVGPDFQREVLNWVSASDHDVISMDALPERVAKMAAGEKMDRFIALTFDDGYLDNLDVAAPILRDQGFPYTIYAATGLMEGSSALWWAGLEWVLEDRDSIEVDFGNGAETLNLRSRTQTCHAFERLMYHCQVTLNEREQRDFVQALCDRYEVDLWGRTKAEMMSVEQMRDLSRDPLCTFGAHTVNHYALGRLDARAARREILAGAEVVAAVTGERPRHLAYPYGNPIAAGEREFALAKELGFKTAVTTRKGAIYGDHADHMLALPRISLNGNYQSMSFTKAWVTGVPALVYNRGRRLSVA